jgi:transcription elongation factor Elf1
MCLHINKTESNLTKMDDGKYHKIILCNDCGQRWYKKIDKKLNNLFCCYNIDGK